MHGSSTCRQKALTSKSSQAHPCSMFTSQTIQTPARTTVVWFLSRNLKYLRRGDWKNLEKKNTLCLKQSSSIRSLTTTLKLPKDTLFVKSASTFHNKSSCSMVLPSGLRIPWHLHPPMINSKKILSWVKLCKPFRNKLTFRRTWQLVFGSTSLYRFLSMYIFHMFTCNVLHSMQTAIMLYLVYSLHSETLPTTVASLNSSPLKRHRCSHWHPIFGCCVKFYCGFWTSCFF